MAQLLVAPVRSPVKLELAPLRAAALCVAARLSELPAMLASSAFLSPRSAQKIRTTSTLAAPRTAQCPSHFLCHRRSVRATSNPNAGTSHTVAVYLVRGPEDRPARATMASGQCPTPAGRRKANASSRPPARGGTTVHVSHAASRACTAKPASARMANGWWMATGTVAVVRVNRSAMVVLPPSPVPVSTSGSAAVADNTARAATTAMCTPPTHSLCAAPRPAIGTATATASSTRSATQCAATGATATACTAAHSASSKPATSASPVLPSRGAQRMPYVVRAASLAEPVAKPSLVAASAARKRRGLLSICIDSRSSTNHRRIAAAQHI